MPLLSGRASLSKWHPSWGLNRELKMARKTGCSEERRARAKALKSRQSLVCRRNSAPALQLERSEQGVGPQAETPEGSKSRVIGGGALGWTTKKTKQNNWLKLGHSLFVSRKPTGRQVCALRCISVLLLCHPRHWLPPRGPRWLFECQPSWLHSRQQERGRDKGSPILLPA